MSDETCVVLLMLTWLAPPGMIQATRGWASGNCSAAALMSTCQRVATRLMSVRQNKPPSLGGA